MLALRAEAARSLGCEIIPLDPETGYLSELRYRGKSFLLLGAFLPLNNVSAARIAEDKFHTALILGRAGFRVPPVARCLRPGRFLQEDFSSHTGLGPAERFAAAHGFPLVVKPNRGARGRDVLLVETTGELTDGVHQVWQSDYLAVVQPVVPGFDVRLDFLDGEFLIGYVRRPVVLEGDGTRTLRQLLTHCDRRFAGATFWRTLLSDPIWISRARCRRLTLESVLAAGEELDLSSAILNLNRLSVAELLHEPSPAWLEQGREIGQELGLRHYGIDFKTANLDDPRAATVLEVNSAPSLAQMARMGYRAEVLAAERRVVKAILAGL